MAIYDTKKTEKVLWSIALPGFGQILNGHLLKGVLFVGLEVLINIKSNLNNVIILSFLGQTHIAVRETNYQWLMFYPCIYMFAVWDAYKYAEESNTPFSFLPGVFSAYLGTIGVIYSSAFQIGGFLLGPVFLPILCMIAGALLGRLLMLLSPK
ncbi:MAG: hypothetical protein AB7G87_03530 [Clostridia bacterium]